MKRIRCSRWTSVVFAVLTTGCVIHPTPPVVGTPMINTLGVQTRLFATVERIGPTRVVSITRLATGYQAGTSTGVQLLDGAGRVLDVARFDMTEKLLSPLVRSRAGSTPVVFAGQSYKPRNSLLIFDESGKRLGAAPPSYYTDLVVADIAEDDRPEVICGGGAIGKTLRIHRVDGSLVRTVELGEVLTSLGAIDADGDGKDELVVYTYPSGRGFGRFRILNESGVTADWKLPAVCSFSSVEVEGKQALLMLEGSAFVVHDIDGATMLRFEDPNLSRGGFCRPVGARLPDGRWFFLASEGSGFPHYLISVFSGSELVYSEIRNDHAHAMLPLTDGDETAVLVGAGAEIWKYSLP